MPFRRQRLASAGATSIHAVSGRANVFGVRIVNGKHGSPMKQYNKSCTLSIDQICALICFDFVAHERRDEFFGLAIYG